MKHFQMLWKLAHFYVQFNNGASNKIGLVIQQVKQELENACRNLNCHIYGIDIKMHLYAESRDNKGLVLATCAIKRI